MSPLPLPEIAPDTQAAPKAARARRIAVVLFNLGGPDRLEAVRPFLYNLFRDPAIIGLPAPFRQLIAHLISSRRDKVAQGIYQTLGGGSPLLPNTLAQARALEQQLWDAGTVRVFVSMRYWHPFSDAVAHDVKDWEPDEVVLLPLYPQFSTTTTASSLKDWQRAAKAAGLTAPSRSICCYPDEPGFVAAVAKLIRAGLEDAAPHGKPRVLFSAHGLPEKVVKGGDPYQFQCERTAQAVVKSLRIEKLDWVSCYQSRVGPMKWIGPSADEEIRRAGQDRVPVVVVPIAFVSEHSETLVEIEHEYRHLAREVGVPHFVRVPTVGVEPSFILGLAGLVRQALIRTSGGPVMCGTGLRLCPAGKAGCPQPASGA
ncbi:ferrochelatase [Nitrospirillum viridazoti]|uniref:Ferrochelatase n=1 Tax=Nitrospirillum amazonense TaxID=28077 RepID=A0A560HL11_9PROT|nr:ferrochelatase [Nitrospirillum amazonense]TWB47207.1 ferrochelatase [Nitrospirillum amazonense]